MTSVSLSQLLESREERQKLQKLMLDGFSLPLVSFTVNMPGSIKLNHQSRLIHRVGVTAIREALAGCIMYFKSAEKVTGPEALFVVDMDPLDIKRRMCDLEEQHQLGRLFDIDVFRTDGSLISREELGQGKRKCLLCSNDAVVCARSRAHGIDELLAKITEMTDRYEENM